MSKKSINKKHLRFGLIIILLINIIYFSNDIYAGRIYKGTRNFLASKNNSGCKYCSKQGGSFSECSCTSNGSKYSNTQNYSKSMEYSSKSSSSKTTPKKEHLVQDTLLNKNNSTETVIDNTNQNYIPANNYSQNANVKPENDGNSNTFIWVLVFVCAFIWLNSLKRKRLR